MLRFYAVLKNICISYKPLCDWQGIIMQIWVILIGKHSSFALVQLLLFRVLFYLPESTVWQQNSQNNREISRIKSGELKHASVENRGDPALSKWVILKVTKTDATRRQQIPNTPALKRVLEKSDEAPLSASASSGGNTHEVRRTSGSEHSCSVQRRQFSCKTWSIKSGAV